MANFEGIKENKGKERVRGEEEEEEERKRDSLLLTLDGHATALLCCSMVTNLLAQSSLDSTYTAWNLLESLR